MNKYLASLLLLILLAGCSKDDSPTKPEDNPSRGDINLNGTSYEIADCVLFANYFTEGITTFSVDQAKQEAATDINADGVTLTVADFVYMVRVVLGDAMAYPNAKPPTTPVSANYVILGGNILEILDGVECGAVRAIIRGDAHPSLLDADMAMKSLYESPYSWVFVYSMDGHHFSGDIISFQGTLMSLELATADGAPVTPTLQSSFEVYPLDQDYPNPFGSGTVDTAIIFLVSEATDYAVTILDTAGNEIETYQGHTEAGQCTVHLDFSAYESGIYYYRLEAQGLTFTRKLLVIN